MNLFDLTISAESEFSTYRHANIRDWIEVIDPVLNAAGLCTIGGDKVEDIDVSDDELLVRTSYSVRCCSQSNEIRLPVSILKATDPIQAATLYRLVNESTLSTPSSTKYLDEYVAEKVEELEAWKASACVIGNDQQREIADLTAKLSAAEERVKELEQDAVTWRGINTARLTDDLIWLYDGIDSIEGPRTLETGDCDRYMFWAPCTWPSTRTIDAEIERSE